MWGKYGKRWKWKRRGVSIDEIAYANREEGTLNVYMFFSFLFFFYQGFLSRTLTTHRIAGEGRGLSFIPLYHFQQLTNIQTFICNCACEMTITYFWSHRLYLPDCYFMRFTTVSNYHLIDWWCDIKFLFVYVMIWFYLFFCYNILRGKPVDLNSHQLSPLY